MIDMVEERTRTYYEILDIPMNSTPEAIQEAYVRAKNAYSPTSLASYSLFSPEESKQIMEEIEGAYSTLSDAQRRKLYDREHGLMVIRTDTNPRVESKSIRIEGGEEVAEIGFVDERDNLDNPNGLDNFDELDSPGSLGSLDNQLLDSTGRTGAINHFALHGHYIQTKKSENLPNFKEIIEEVEKIDGPLLKELRELKSITMDEIMEFTKLSRKHIDSLERDDLEKLPAPVYVRGFVIQYAKALRLDTKIVATGYMRNFQYLRESHGM